MKEARIRFFTCKAILLATIAVFLGGQAYAQVAQPASDVTPVVVPEAVMKRAFPSLKRGKLLRLKADKIVVLALWATWCGPCRVAVEGLNDISGDFASQGVTFVALTTEDRRAAGNFVRIFVARSKIQYPMGWVNSSTAEILMNGRNTIPQILLLSNDGVVLRRFLGWNQEHTKRLLSEAIKEELQKTSSANRN